MSTYRKAMIESEMAKLLSSIIFEMKDPRLSGKMISVTRVELSNDKRYADVYISVFGSDEEKKEVFEALEHALGFLRTQVSRNLRLRVAPEIRLREDKGIEASVKIHKLLEEIHERDSSDQ
ncbi:MAG: ribosome-binding factor [Thermotogota bacterium]|nr:ribosome-binding factor [Thermotogota bacterium]MDK2864087.1 ribosome-binding factor [Thermotogota bacterium]HCZ06217.1 30S ribosome-binding factor RbfA [Thermotogota bacterium]